MNEMLFSNVSYDATNSSDVTTISTVELLNFTATTEIIGEQEPDAGVDPISMLLGGESIGENEDPLQLLIARFHQAQMEDCQNLVLSCEERPLYTILIGYGFIFVFLLALFGNMVNLMIYNTEHIKYFIAIRMLCTRLLMNTLTLIFILPQALRIISTWEPGSELDHIYWTYYPYRVYFVNLFGFCAMWLTVLMTAECYLHVFFPQHSKSLCTKKNLTRSYVLIFSVGATLALMYKFNRKVSLTTHCNKTIISINASEDFYIVILEKIHTFANLLLAIVVPMSLLLFMAISILWKLVLRKTEFATHFTSEKRCVTRISLITTGLQLISELPPIPVFIYATIFGPAVINEPTICVWNTIAVFLGLCNVSLSFFVYLVFSDKFRKMVKNRLGELFRPCIKSSHDMVHYTKEQRLDPRSTSTLLSRDPQTMSASPDVESSICTETYLLNERSSTYEHLDAFL